MSSVASSSSSGEPNFLTLSGENEFLRLFQEFDKPVLYTRRNQGAEKVSVREYNKFCPDQLSALNNKTTLTLYDVHYSFDPIDIVRCLMNEDLSKRDLIVLTEKGAFDGIELVRPLQQNVTLDFLLRTKIYTAQCLSNNTGFWNYLFGSYQKTCHGLRESPRIMSANETTMTRRIENLPWSWLVFSVFLPLEIMELWVRRTRVQNQENAMI